MADAVRDDHVNFLADDDTKVRMSKETGDDDEELFEMLSRELSRSCSLLDHSPQAAGSCGAGGWDPAYAAAEERSPNFVFPPHNSVTSLQRQLQQADRLRWMKMKQLQEQEEMEMLMMMQMRRDMLEEEIRFMRRNNQIGPNRITLQNRLSPCDWPQKAKPQCEGMRLGPQKASAGTGVFLPRRPADLYSKPGFPTVLVPERVIQALNQHKERLRNIGCPRAPAIPAGFRDDERRSTSLHALSS